ncbi:hypothetical protein [Streptomyces sp. NPDC000410]|uniref:hypothetical protein n=1 Tax=Streptomyces sp. NPDC000410 TaxID=3154254 RepID=UPI00331818BB
MNEREVSLPRSLLRSILADPRHLPELLARFAVRHMGPPAGRSVARLREDRPDADPGVLRARVVSRGMHATVTEGAFVGGPFLVFIPVAFCAAALRQARTILELAALDGRDATDLERAAELLVVQGVYGDTDQAREALTRTPAKPARAAKKGGTRLTALWDVTTRMARLLGLVTPERPEGPPSLWSRIGAWTLLVAVLLVGMVAPLVWLPYMAVSYQRATAQLLARATVFYFGGTAVTPRRRSRLNPAQLGGALRAVATLLVPLGLILLTVVMDIRLAGSTWPVLGIALISASVAVGALWYVHRWRSRRGRDQDRDQVPGLRP